MTRFLIAAAMATMVLAGGAQAQSRQAPNPFDPNKIYRGIDQLAGMVTDELFKRADVNRDGALSPRELSDAAESGSLPFSPDPRTWAAFDINRDGVLSRAEILEAIRRVQVSTRNGVKPF